MPEVCFIKLICIFVILQLAMLSIHNFIFLCAANTVTRISSNRIPVLYMALLVLWCFTEKLQDILNFIKLSEFVT